MSRHWYCRSDQHEKCDGKKLKDGIGPVEVEPCVCDCHRTTYVLMLADSGDLVAEFSSRAEAEVARQRLIAAEPRLSESAEVFEQTSERAPALATKIDLPIDTPKDQSGGGRG